MYRSLFTLYLLFLSLSWTGICHAQANAELYDAVAPPDSAFIRAFNMTDSSIQFEVSTKIHDQRIPAGQFGGYRFVEPGSHRLTINGHSIQVDLTANTASTLIYRTEQIQVVNDSLINEPRRAQISFYNLTSSDAVLETADGKHRVIGPVTPGQTSSRMINEVRIGLAASIERYNTKKHYEPLLLRRGQSYSYAVLSDNSGYKVVSATNTIDAND